MSEVDQLREIRTELREMRLLLEKVLSATAGKDWTSDYLDRRVKREAEFRRAIADSGLYNLGVPKRGRDGLRENADLLTLEEVSAWPRDKVATVDGVGPKTMKKLDAAMADRGLFWAEAG
jgi:hypothetical protein